MVHLRRLVFGLFFVCLAALALHRVIGYDIWWQIAAGEWIVEHGIPATDPFSYAFPGREWIEPRWLFCVFAWAVFDNLGLNFLILAKLGFVVAAFGLLYLVGHPRHRWATICGMLIALLAAHQRFMIRPELFTFVTLTLTLLCLHRYKGGGGLRWIAPLPLLQVLWSNTHTLWILGPVTQWIFLAGEWLQSVLVRRWPGLPLGGDVVPGHRLRRLGLVACVSTLAALANPYFLDGFLFPFRLFTQIGSDHYLSGVITEIQGPFTNPFFGLNYLTVVYGLVVGLSLLSFVLNRRGLSLSRVALWVAFLVLTVKAQRNLVFFGFVAGVTTIVNLVELSARSEGRRWPAGVSRAVWITAGAYLLFMVPFVATDHFYRQLGSAKRFGFGITEHRHPVRALAFARQAGLPGPLLHALGDGGYVMFEGGAKSVYVDGRLEVYDESIFRRALPLTTGGRGLKEETKRLGLSTVLVRNDPGYGELLQTLESSPDWVPVYYDDLHQLYLRVTTETAELVERHAIDWDRPAQPPVTLPEALDPPDWLGGLWPKAGDAQKDARLGSFFTSVGNYEMALRHFEAAVEQHAGDPRSCLFLGLFRLAAGRDEEGSELLARAPAGALDQAEVNRLAGEIHIWGGRPDAAIGYFERAAELGAPEPFASEGVARAAIAAGRGDLAEATLRQLLQDYPERFRTWNLLGVLAVRQGRPQQAIAAFERSLQLNPGQPRVRETLRTLTGQE